MASPSGPDRRASALTSTHSPSSPPHVQQLPTFDTQFRAPSPYFYFHHIIDPVAATLEVQVLGPDLRFTFTHSRAIEQGLSPSQVASSLSRKTAGFVSLLKPRGPTVDGASDEKRVVLAWAESGHGAGRVGDVLDSGGGALANALWTRRAVRMAALLGLRMDRPFDKMGVRGQTRDDLRGVFLASHVEVKLAVHAIYLLLFKFRIPFRSRNPDQQLSRRALRQLRRARWAGGSRPVIEIFFSRRNCAPCGTFVRRLAALTGVDIRLVWRERLVRVVYEKRRCAKGASSALREEEMSCWDDDDEEQDVDGSSGDELHALGTVDLTAPSQPDVEPEVKLEDDGNGAARDGDREESGLSAVDAFIDGLAYCVGQSSPTRAAAAAAVVDLAQRIRRRARVTQRVLSKPLPATPEIDPPAWMARARQRDRGTSRRLAIDGW